MSPIDLCAIGWKPFFQQQVPSELIGQVIVARVSAHHGSTIHFLCEEGEISAPVQLAESQGEVAIGDWLALDVSDLRAVKRFERQTLICRKASGREVKRQVIAANIDTIFIVSSCNEDFNLSRIERYLVLTLQAGAIPVVVLTKADLCEDASILRRQVERLHTGLLVEVMDARQPKQTEVLLSWCGPGQSVALLGSSGVGKSTLATALGVVGLATGEIRLKDGKGRHTTTARSLHPLPSGGILVDNPGLRELQLPGCEDGFADLFDDVFRIAERCRFSNCKHNAEPGCAVTAALEAGELDERRFVNFVKLNAEQARNSSSLAERRDRERRTGRFYKSVVAEKRRRRDLN